MLTPELALGVVLSGGRSSRFGGVDKGLQLLHGRPLVAHALESLSDCAQTVISTNRHLPRYAAFNHPLVSDQRADFQGPLSGLESVMLAHPAAWYAVCPADVVGAPAHWWQRLLQHAQQHQLPYVGTRDGERVQPLVAVFSHDVLPMLSSYLDSGERRVMQFVSPWLEQALPLPEGRTLHNLNTEESLAAMASPP